MFNGFTYKLMAQGQEIWISGLPVSFDGFTYKLKTQGQIFGLVNYHHRLMNSHMYFLKTQGQDIQSVKYHCYLMDSHTS